MLINLKSFIKIENSNELAKKIFFLGLFFLPSAIIISGIFFITSLFIAFRFNKINFFESKWDLMLSISLILIVISTINNTLINVPEELIYESKFSIWISLFNWIPLYFFYWGFSIFLKTETERITSLKFLISGSIPVLLTCFFQEFFNLYGPFKTFFGLIVWYNKPLIEIGGTTGLFSNPNYSGAFLTLTLPFLYFFLRSKENQKIEKKLFLFFITFFTLFFSITTNSRNALIGIIISFFSIVNIRKLTFYILMSFSGIFIFTNSLSNILKFIFNQSIFNMQSFCMKNNYISLFCQIFVFQFSLMTPRIRIWAAAFSAIKDRPLWGWGSSTFTYLYPYKEKVLIPYRNLDVTHSHNIILEIAHNFGIPVALILTFTILSLFINTFKLVVLNNKKLNSINKSWIISLLILLFLHLFDITYYDGRISIILIILLAGTKCIIQEQKDIQFKKIL